jgi:hypothetical protein
MAPALHSNLRRSGRLLKPEKSYLSTPFFYRQRKCRHGSPGASAEAAVSEGRLTCRRQPFRSFIYAKQESLFQFDEIQIPIKQHAVGTAVAASALTEVIISFDLPQSRVFLFKALVHKAQGGEFTDGISSGGIHEFRFVDSLPWRRAVLEAARWLGFPVSAKVVETMSTCTLRYRPADVHEVHAWSALLDEICKALKAGMLRLGENQTAPVGR